MLNRIGVALSEGVSEAAWFCYGDTNDSWNAGRLGSVVLGHLKRWDVKLDQTTVQTDNGSEYVGHIDKTPEKEVRFPDSQVLDFKVTTDRTGVEHLLLLRTPHDLLALSWEVLGPDGKKVCEGSDPARRGGWRRTSFVPQAAGDDTVRIKPKEGSFAYDTDWVAIDVIRGKRQILWPLIERFLYPPFETLPT